MKLTAIRVAHAETAAVVTDAGLIPLTEINRRGSQDFPVEIMSLLQAGRLSDLAAWLDRGGIETLGDPARFIIPNDDATVVPLYRHPPKIWGIGLNYREHAADLDENAPDGIPASFMKPATAIIGPEDAIAIPLQSIKTTAEAELGIVIGKQCKNVRQSDWLDVVAGFVPVIDMTAEDILRRNPRYLTLSKSFNTFFSFGPELITPDEVGPIENLTVATIINGHTHARNTVSNMTFKPDMLVSFHSQIMTLLPGDIISTGTPGAVPIQDGDRVTCAITGMAPLSNPVVDLKRSSVQ